MRVLANGLALVSLCLFSTDRGLRDGLLASILFDEYRAIALLIWAKCFGLYPWV
jgi:hypothetical protein